MKLLKNAVFSLLVTVLLVSCSSTPASAPVVTLGNTNGNISNNGLYTVQDARVYFSDIMNGYTLTTMNVDGTGIRSLGEASAMSLNVSGNWLYFIQMQDSGEAFLYKIKTDGTEKTRITDATCDMAASCILVDDTLYFSNTSDNSSLYSVKTDGSELKKINDVPSFRQTYQDEWIVYICMKTNEDTQESILQLRKIQTDGKKEQVLVDNVGSNSIAHNGWIYYTADNFENLLYRIRLDGTGQEQLTDFGVASLNIEGDTLFYTTLDQGLLSRSGLDGSDAKQLTEKESYGILIAGDWVYFLSRAEQGRPYKVDRNGEHLEKAYVVDLVEPDPALLASAKGIGTSSANVNGELKFVSQGDWIYFNTDVFSGPIRKMQRADASSVTTVAEVAARRLSVVGDWLYFIDGDFFNSLARVRTDGSGYSVIHDASCSELIVQDGWMYFIDSADQHPYKIGIDGTGLMRLSEDSPVGLYLDGDWLYFSTQSADGFGKHGIHRVGIDDGSESTLLYDKEILSMTVADGWVFYAIEDKTTMEYQLRRMNADGSGDILLRTGDLATLAGVHNGMLYYFNGSEEEGIVRTALDGSSKTVLAGPGNFVWIHFLEDYIIYYDNGLEQYTMMGLDGSGATELTLE